MLSDASKLTQFLNNVIQGKEAMHYDSAVIPKQYDNLKVLVGQDFHPFIESNKGHSKLVLVTHPLQAKNWGIDDALNRYAGKEPKSLKNIIPSLYA